MKTIKSFLEKRRHKKEVVQFVRYIGDDQKKFDELISYCFGADPKLAERASWPVCYCVEAHPELMKKHFKKLLKQLRMPCHNSIRRNFTKLMEYIEIPKALHAETISVCFDLLNNKDEFVAVKVFSMSQLGRFCKIYPELKKELIASIEAQFNIETAAFRARAKVVLKSLAQRREEIEDARSSNFSASSVSSCAAFARN